MAGMSQPHIHNVLKGVRSLSFEYADRILDNLQISIFNLLSEMEPETFLPKPALGATVDIPRLRGRVGPASFLEEQSHPGDFFPVARIFTEQLTNPVLVTLGHDPSLYPFLQEHDVLLVTRPHTTAATLDNASLYLVQTRNGTLIRSLRLARSRLYLITPSTRDEPRNWTELPLHGRQVGDVVWGKLVGLGRLFRREPFGRGP